MLKFRFLGMILALSMAGCGGRASDAPVRRVVAGKVSIGGAPLPKGRITLYPVEGTNGPASGAEIKEGAYRIAAKGGVPVGTHRVEIHQYEVKPVIPGRPPALEIENNILPDQYNKKSTVELTVDPANKEIVQDYNLDKDFGAVTVKTKK